MHSRKDLFNVFALVSGCYEFVLALFILFQLLLALLALEVARFLPTGWPLSGSRRIQHNSFCSGHFPPFSPCRERQGERLLGLSRIPTRSSPGSVLGRSVSYVPRSGGANELTFSRTAGLGNQSRSFSFSSAYRGKHRQNNTCISDERTSAHTGSIDDGLYQCIAPSLDLYDDLIEVSSEYLKQKDRGHEEVILSLLKALQVERKNLRILYEELDEERVASETAANEAMSMILRLQEEKSALQMEADHYQRMAEEKVIYDEHAIQLLEEDLCKKENERFHLEEELIKLRKCACSNDSACEITENGKEPPLCSVKTKHLLLLTDGTDERLSKVRQNAVSVMQVQECEISQGIALYREESCEKFSSSYMSLKRPRSATQCKRDDDLNDIPILHENLEGVPLEAPRHLGKYHPNDEEDTESILNQLSAVEKQLLDLEEYKKLELWQQARASHNSLINKFLCADSCFGSRFNARDDIDGDSQVQTNTLQTSEMDDLAVSDEERVINVDVACDIIGPCEMQAPASKERLETYENEYRRSECMQWEAFEKEKHLDLMSCVKRSDSHKRVTGQFGGNFRTKLEEENCNAKWVTLEDANLQLQALESESRKLQHH